MKHSARKILIPAISVLSGFVISYFAFRSNPQLINQVSAGELRSERKEFAQTGLLKKKLVNPVTPDRFFDHDELFEEMERMQERMRDHFKNFDHHDLVIDDSFEKTLVGGVSQREDSEYVYLDVPITDLDETTVDTNVVNDYVTISGTVEKKYNAGEGLFRSSFSRTFPLPEGVDQNQMAVVPQKGKVTLKFPKLKV